VPLWRSHRDHARGEAGGWPDEGKRVMTSVVTRRAVLKGGGALVVSLALPLNVAGAQGSQLGRRLSPAQLDTYLSIAEDGGVTAFYGKIDMGQGVDVAIAQIVAEEIDVPFDRVRIVMGDSALTVDQGGGSGSTALERGGSPLRSAAAEARSVLLGLASEKLKIPVDELTVTDGVVHSKADPAKRASYGELIGGRHFDVTMKWNGRMGNALDAKGTAEPKRPEQYKLVGQPVPRPEVAEMLLGTKKYVADIRLPGMMHARVLRPARAGANLLAVNEASIASIRGARVVREGDFLAVVAESEWDAVRAAKLLKATWSNPPAPFSTAEGLYDYIRKAPVVRESSGSGFDGSPTAPAKEPVEAALASSARRIEAEYEFPFQSHASMGPACAVADYRDGNITVWTGSQKPHAGAEGVAKLLKLPRENVRSIWVSGPGSYGRNDAGDAALDAALISRAIGRPVRVHGTREDGHAWDPKAPASVHFARAGFDAQGNVTAYYFRSKGFSAGDVAPFENSPSDTLAGQLTGWPNASVFRFGNPEGRYQFPVKLEYWQAIDAFLKRGSPLRTGHLRDPLGPQLHFASESFIDEMASAVGADPIEFRLRHLKEARDVAVLKAAMERAQWQPRPAGPTVKQTSGVVSGRGVAYTRRSNSVVAAIAYVDVDLSTGRVWPRKFIVATEQGLIVNPLGLHRTIEGNVVMAVSRTLQEEVQFTPQAVTSVDWATYPILEMADAPEEIDVVMLNRTDLPPYGAGEPSTRTIPPAIANAVFDATGVRIRRAPFTPERVRAALSRRA
jgi:CO/xanthine dehydrogenase Mo-binding subunit